MANQTWNKGIRNPPSTPLLDWIEAGSKKYEGRIFSISHI